MSRTFTQLIAAVETRMADGDGSGSHAGVRWLLQEKKDALNLKLREFCRETEVLTSFVTFVQSAGAIYTPSGSTRVVRLLTHPQSATAGRKLTPTTEDDLFDLTPTWEEDTGTASRYVFPYTISGDTKTLLVYPFPAPADDWEATTAYEVGDYVVNGSYTYVCDTAGTSAGSGGPTGTGTNITDGTARWDYWSDSTSIALDDLKARCVIIAADLSNGSDVSAIPGDYHDAIVEGACAYLLKKNGESVDADLAAAMEATYLAAIRKAKSMSGFNSAPVDVPTEWF